MQRVGLQGGRGYDATGNCEGAGSQGYDASPDCQVDWGNSVIDMAHRRGDNDRPEVLGHGFIEVITWRQGMSREVMQMALNMLNEIADDVYCDQKLEGVIAALRQALDTDLARVGEVGVWGDCEPQEEVEDGWCNWVCPKPQGYLMQCCDCELIHT